MDSVEGIIKAVYGTRAKACEHLRTTTQSVTNWKRFGYFPHDVAIELCKDARRAGVLLDITDIPVRPSVRGDA